ncbi:hypothetical protein GH741_12850 [Aquibacillus halophilus]|uniref:Transcriptional regulator SgrR N-terminal HTH domain-containing protein n=1 Tax=Aquibacillus halophilus TaxID=930132 RepID=A0A6A8DIE8_9BACI|nr:hypothetical protein [Aquibacillus halophilus]
MNIEELYIKLRNYYSNHDNGEQIEVDLNELVDTLSYTKRKFRKFLIELDALGWITWSPKGIKNNDSLIFHQSIEDVQLQLFKAMIFDGRQNEAFIRVESEAPSIKTKLTYWYYLSKFVVYFDVTKNRQFIRIREMITKENVDIYCNAIKESLEHASPGFTILIDMMSEMTNTPDVEPQMEELRKIVVAKGVKALASYTSSSYLIPYLEKRLDEMGQNKIFPTKEAAEEYLDSL